MKRTTAIFLLTLLIVGVQANAQQNNRNRNNRAPSLSVGLQVSDPQGEYAQHYKGHPTGLGVTFMANMGRSPLEIGGDFAWRAMGSQKEDISISQGEDIEGDEIFSEGTLRVASNVYAYHGVARFKPFGGAFQPYADVMGGMKTYATRTTIEEDNGGYTEVVENERNHRDFALSYGWAAGLKIKLSEYIMLEGKFQHLKGGETTFVDPDTVEINDKGSLLYEETATRSSVMLYQVGISLEF
jgi:opacity protein-like surface antigen